MGQVSSFYTEAREKELPRILKRMDEITKAAICVERMLHKKHAELKPILCCSVERLDTALTSYFYDIYRYKHFHGMLGSENEKKSGDSGGEASRVNFAKIYAFTAKWLMKERPFYLKTPQEVAVSEGRPSLSKSYITDANLINEIVFMTWMCTNFESQRKEKLKIEPLETKKILYSLKYREISTAFFELFLMGKADFSKKKKSF